MIRMAKQSPFRVLIAGAGITGPVAAYWLIKASTASRPIHVTIIERGPPSVIELGQGIDIKCSSKEVVIRMGLLEAIKSRMTGEKGFHCIDKSSRPYAKFEGGGLTQEIEIMRGDLCDVFITAIKDSPNVTIQYNRQITSLEQSESKVRVTILPRETGESYEEEYEAVIAADGVRSKTRDIMFDSTEAANCVKPMGLFVAFFSAPPQPQDADYSRWQHAVGSRSLVLRPVTSTHTSIYLLAVGNEAQHPALAETSNTRDPKVKRQAWADVFNDLDYGEFPRVLKAIMESENFYADEISQVKLPTWSKGRCAVAGDAGYCPSPITGQGTELAIAGAYILAGELATNLDDPAAAFKKYEEVLRPYVTESQNIAFGGRIAALVNPQTRWGIAILQTVLWLVAASKITKLFPDEDYKTFETPNYECFASNSE